MGLEQELAGLRAVRALLDSDLELTNRTVGIPVLEVTPAGYAIVDRTHTSDVVESAFAS
jgi:hypothetical protein